MAEFFRNWMEYFFLLAMVIGLVFAIFVKSAFVSYLLVLASGAFAGRILFERRHKIVLPYYVAVSGFLVGYLITMRYGSRLIVVFLFVAGGFLSYRLFAKGHVRDTRF